MATDMRFLDKVGRWCEVNAIIPIHEGLNRLKYHLDPRLYSRRLRVKRVTDGLVDKKSNKYAIFVLYSKTSLPAFTTNFIDAISRSPFNLIIVSNSRLDALLRAQLQEQCFLLMERANLGRDFGAYKDGIEYLLGQEKDVDRLLLANDSLFFFSGGLDGLIASFDGPQDFIGATEVLQFHYHVQSYMLSFSGNVLKNRLFRRYWAKYRPVSTRRWSIHKGEVGLTRLVTRAGYRPHVLYQAAHLAPHLQQRTIRDVLEAMRLFPAHIRRHLNHQFIEIVGEDTSGVSFVALDTISMGVRTVSDPSIEDRSTLEDGRGRESGKLKSKNSGRRLAWIERQATTMSKLNFEILTRKIIAVIAERNQIHIGGFFFMSFLGIPFIKRDIFYREVYSLEEAYQILSDLNEPLRDEVMSDLRRGGTAAHIRGFQKILYRHGSI